MKILLVHKFWRKVGGAENYFQDVARILRSNGHRVKIFTTDIQAEGSVDAYERTGDVFFGDYTEYLNGSFLKKIFSIPEIIYSTSNKLSFGKLLDEYKPDVVHVFAIFTTITPSILDACGERKIPVVMSCNDYKHICPNYLLYQHGKICEACKGGKFYNAIIKNCCKHSLGVSIVSSMEAYYHGLKNTLRKNIKMFLFESEFMLNKTKEFWGETSFKSAYLGKPFHAPGYSVSDFPGKYILYMGRLSHEKGVDILINAMKNNPEAQLKITGDGQDKQSLENLCKQLQLKNVEFTGALWGEKIKQMMLNAKFVVIPSVWYENFPYVLTESFAMGKAVIGSDKGGIPEYIQHGKTGFVYPAGSSETLEKYIHQLWNDDKLTAEMGKAAKQYADENFNDEKFYNRLLKIYSSVINITEAVL